MVFTCTMNSSFMKNQLGSPETFQLDKTYQHISHKYSFIIVIFHNLKNLYLKSRNRIFQLPYNKMTLQNTGKQCLSSLNFSVKNL